MMNLRKTRLGYYENIILSEYFPEDSVTSFHKIGAKNYEKSITIDLNKLELTDEGELRQEILEVVDFLSTKQVEVNQEKFNSRPIWFQTNFIDQAVRDYVGIGLLNVEGEWLKFILYSLGLDRADQNGDSCFTIFDEGFNWAINFELSQDYSCLTVQKFEK